jgi:hypothetical protein
VRRAGRQPSFRNATRPEVAGLSDPLTGWRGFAIGTFRALSEFPALQNARGQLLGSSQGRGCRHRHGALAHNSQLYGPNSKPA